MIIYCAMFFSGIVKLRNPVFLNKEIHVRLQQEPGPPRPHIFLHMQLLNCLYPFNFHTDKLAFSKFLTGCWKWPSGICLFLLLLFLFLIIIVHILLEINELKMDCKVQDYKMCLQVFHHLLFQQYLPSYSVLFIPISWDVGLLQSRAFFFCLLISM